MLRSLTLVTLLAGSASAWAADPVHSIRSDQDPFVVVDHSTGTTYLTSDLSLSEALIAWQEDGGAFVHAVAVTNSGDEIELRLVTTSSATSDAIEGAFDIYVNGSLECDDCLGEAYGLDQAASPGVNYFKIYVGTPSSTGTDWLFSSYMTSRQDY